MRYDTLPMDVKINTTLSTDGLTDTGTAPASIIDVTTQSFMAEVIEASRAQLVLVDFWAPWCEPCKQLTPLLEKLTQETNGAMRLAKMNIDADPAIPQQLGVQSIPTVLAFKNAQAVDGFVGVLPESALREFLEKHLDNALAPSPSATRLDEAEASDQPAYAQSIFAEVRAQEPDNIRAIVGLAKTYIDTDMPEQAETLLAQLTPALANAPEVLAIRAMLDMQKKSATLADDLSPLYARIKADTKDHAARYDLAVGLFAQDQAEEAIEILLASVKLDRNWNDEAARKQLVEFFAMLGADNDLTLKGRRQLSSILFS